VPVQPCQENERPGFKWGDGGKCFTYTKGDEAGAKRAREKAATQGQAIAFSRARKAGRKKPSGERGDFD